MLKNVSNNIKTCENMYIITNKLGEKRLGLNVKEKKKEVKVDIKNICKNKLRKNLEELKSITEKGGIIRIELRGLVDPMILLNDLKKSERQFAFPYWLKETRDWKSEEIDAGVVIANIKGMQRILKRMDFEGNKFFTGILRRFDSMFDEKKEALELFYYILKNDGFEKERKKLIKHLVRIELVNFYSVNEKAIEEIKKASNGLFKEFKATKTFWGFFVEIKV